MWLPARADGEEQDGALLSGPDVSGLRWELPAPSPIFVTTKFWHDGDGPVDAFWGPSIHWNDHIKQYVMLINRAADETFAQEGIYISLNPRLDDPAAWTVPAKIFDGGSWYPQVIGTEPGSGTDKRAGREARFFMGGRSDYLIRFDP